MGQDKLKPIDLTFPNCPNCGSTQRFFETLANEVKSRGLARPEWTFSYEVRQGAVVDKVKDKFIPIGTELPGYLIKTDICMDCGIVYAIELHSHSAKKTIVPPPIVLPGSGPAGMNDPRYS